MMRRRVLVRVVVAGALAVGVVAASVAVASSAAPQGVADGLYDQSPTTAPRPETHQLPDGRWESYLLPFAAPFPTESALRQALADAREQGLIA